MHGMDNGKVTYGLRVVQKGRRLLVLYRGTNPVMLAKLW